MTTLTAKYATLETLERNYFDFSDFSAHMEFYGYTTRLNRKNQTVEVIDPETNEVVDNANPIVITHNGERFYELLSCQMESTLNLGGEWFSTIMDEVETTNYPYMIRQALKK